MLFTLNIRKLSWLLVSAATLTLALGSACKKDEAAKDKTSTKTTAELVVLSKEGTTLDPAVPKARIPDGSWICDMGTVHYGRTEKGDGVCPLCGMPLTQTGASAEPASKNPTNNPAATPTEKEPAAAPTDPAAPAEPAEEAAPAATDANADDKTHTGHSH